MSKVLKIGHRGAMGYEPENTLRSFQKALDLGVDMIELDVFRCKSGEIIAFHDEKLNQLTNGTGYVTKKTLAELKKLDAGKGEKIPTLEEALDLIDRKCQVNIELKGKRTLNTVLKVIEKYVRNKGWKYEDFIISSFMRHKLKKIPKHHTPVRIGALLSYRIFHFFKFAKKIKAYSVHIKYNLVNEKFVKKAHKKGLKVFVWTVNEPEEIQRFKDMGVDGIFSDFPDRI